MSSSSNPTSGGRQQPRAPRPVGLLLFVAMLATCIAPACRHEEKAASGVTTEPAVTAEAGPGGSETPRGDNPPVKERLRDKLKRLFRAQANKLRTLGTFDSAKRAARKIYEDRRTTFYCGCDYSEEGTIDGKRCGYEPRIKNRRATRLEWEHIVPAHAFGGERTCWRTDMCIDSKGKRYGGRECCEKQDPEFRGMEADLQNLVPEVGELNQDRSNFGYGDVAGEERKFGRCDFEVDGRAKVAEIDPSLRGDVARAYLYMYHAYPGRLDLTPDDLGRFQTWHEEDPPTAWEVERNERIKRLQGAGNPLIEIREQVEPPTPTRSEADASPTPPPANSETPPQ